jgi:hypothetical protein
MREDPLLLVARQGAGDYRNYLWKLFQIEVLTIVKRAGVFRMS